MSLQPEIQTPLPEPVPAPPFQESPGPNLEADFRRLVEGVRAHLRTEPLALAAPHVPLDPDHLAPEARQAWGRLRQHGQTDALTRAEGLAAAQLSEEAARKSPGQAPDHFEIALEHRRLLETKTRLADLPAVRDPLAALHRFLVDQKRPLAELAEAEKARPERLTRSHAALARLQEEAREVLKPLFRYPNQVGPKLERRLAEDPVKALVDLGQSPESLGQLHVPLVRFQSAFKTLHEPAQAYLQASTALQDTDAVIERVRPLRAEAHRLEGAVHQALDQHLGDLHVFQKLPDTLPASIRERFEEARKDFRQLPRLTVLIHKIRQTRAWPDAQRQLERVLETTQPSPEHLARMARLLGKGEKTFLAKVATLGTKAAIGIAVTAAVRVGTAQ